VLYNGDDLAGSEHSMTPSNANEFFDTTGPTPTEVSQTNVLLI